MDMVEVDKVYQTHLKKTEALLSQKLKEHDISKEDWIEYGEKYVQQYGDNTNIKYYHKGIHLLTTYQKIIDSKLIWSIEYKKPQ
jgi:hypothetical protein